MVLNKEKAVGYNQKEVVLDHIGGTPFVHIVWSGIKRIPSTHNLIVIRTELDDAVRICDGMNRYDQDQWAENALEYWVESVCVNHIFGQSCKDVAQRKAWIRQRDGD